MQRNAVKLTEAEKLAFSLAREALCGAEIDLTQRIMDYQNTLETASEADKAYFNAEIAKAQVKLADSIVSRERLWAIQYKI